MRQIDCATLQPLGSSHPARMGGLFYDAHYDRYLDSLTTDYSLAGTCQQVTFSFIDGTSYSANFKFKPSI